MPRALISPFALRATRPLLVVALALTGLTCRDNSPMGPGLPTRTSLALVPHFETVPGGPVVQLDKARVQVFRMPVSVGDAAIVDTTASFVGNDALTLDISVPVLGASNDFLYRITAMDAAGNIIYAATDSITVLAGAAPVTPEIAVLRWATADTLVRSLRVLPRDTVITANEPFLFGVVAKKADSSVVVASVGWVSRDETRLHMDQGTGTATALSQFSNVWIVATMGTGLKDSTLVSATQPVVSVVVSPPSATLFVAATQQLIAQVEAAGGVPLPTRPVQWISSNPAVATVSATGLVTTLAVGTTTITAISGGVSGTSTITVARKIPTITWTTPADISYGTALSATQLNANAVFNSASVPGTFVYNPAAGTVLNAGTALPLSVTFTPADPTIFAGATGATTINVNKANQTITFAALPDRVFGEPGFTVTATATSGLAVTFAASGNCTVSGSTVSLTGSGSCTITASQSGDANRNAAADVARTFNIGKASLQLSVASASGVYGGTTTLSATVTAGGAPLAFKNVIFSINALTVEYSTTTNSSGVATVPNASLDGINVGTYLGAISPPSGIRAIFPEDANFNRAEAVATLIVTQATASLTLGQLNYTYDDTPKPVPVTSTPAGLSGVAVTYNTLATAPSAAGSYSVVASLTNQNYQAANATGTLVIGQASQTISFAPLPPRTLGDPAFTVSATSSSGLAVTFGAAGSCTISGDQVTLVAEGTCTITASQSGNTNYSAASSVAQSFEVAPRPVATVEINPPSALVQVGQNVLFVATIRAGNGEALVRPVIWTTGNSGIATVDNGVVTGVAVGQTTVTATVEGKSATATVDVQPPPIVIDSTHIASVDGDTLFSIGARRLLGVNAYSGNVLVAGVYTWQSSNIGVATVDGFGTVTAIANGTATITATEKGGTSDVLQIVVVQKLARMAISPGYMKLVPNDTARFSASGYDALNNPMNLSEQVRWSTPGYYQTVARIDSATGAVTAGLPGNQTIVAISGELEARALVEVQTLVRNVKITGTETFGSLGEIHNFTATAYDADGKPVTAGDVSWESLNESVVRPTGVDGDTMSATSYTNGSATLRATIDGVRGDLAVVVSQQLKNIVVYPSVVNIDVGGIALLSAEGRDVNNRTMILAPGSFSWQSQNEAAVTVDPVSGVVVGASRGSSAVTAVAGQGGLIPSTSANVTVAPTVTTVSFGANLLSVGKGQRLPVTLYLNQAATSTITLSLSVAGPYATWAASSVTFNVGESAKVVGLDGLQAGTTTITAFSDGVESTITLAVQPVASLPYVGGDAMNAGEELATKVYLNDPAPAGGSWVTFSYSAPGVVSIFPERAFIPAGQLAADIVVRATGGGITTIVPTVPGLTGRVTPEIYVFDAVIGVSAPQTSRYIGVGQFEFGPTQGGYQGGYGTTIRERAAKSIQQAQRPGTESASTRVAARIPGGDGQWADGYYYYGSCSGFLGEVLTGGVGLLYGYPRADYCLTLGTDPEPPVTAQLTSSNPGVLLVEGAVEMDYYTAGFSVAAVTPGSATVTASASGWTPGVIPVVVTTPRLNVISGYGEGFEFGDSVTLRDVGSASYYLEVGDSIGNPHPLINSLRVRVNSSDPSVFTVNDSVKVLDAGGSSVYGYLALTPVGTGSAWLRFQSDGHLGDSVYVTVPKRGLLVPRMVTIGAGQKEILTVATKRPEPDTSLRVSVRSLTDTSSASIDSGAAFVYSYAFVNFRGYQPGSTDFVLTSAGFDPETVTVVVTTPRLQMNFEVLQQPVGSTATLALYLYDSLGNSHSPIAPVTASLRSLDSLIATVTPTVSLDLNYTQAIQLSALAVGSTRIIVEAPGYVSDTMDVEVFRTPLSFSYSDMSVGVGARQAVYGYYTTEPYVTIPSFVVDAADSVVLRIRHQTNGRTTIDSPRLVIYQNYQQTSRFTVVGESVGVDTLIVEDSTGRYAPDTMYVTVLPSRIWINNDSAVVSVANQNGLPYQLQLTDVNGTWIAFGKPVTLKVTSSNPGVVAVNNPTIMANNGDMNFNFGLVAVGAGTADITISDSSGQIGSGTVHVTVTGARLRPSTAFTSVGIRQRSQDAYVWVEQTDSSQRVITLTSSDPTIASVPDTVILGPYSQSAYFPIIGHDTLGTVRIRMAAPGLEPAFMDVDVGRPRIVVYVSDAGPANSSQQMEIYATDQMGYRRYPVEPVAVTLVSSDPSVAGSDTALFTIPASDCQYEVCPTAPTMFYRMPGRTVFTARDNRYPSLVAYKPYVDTINVKKPAMYLEPLNYWYGLYVGSTQQDSLRLNLQGNATTAVTVTLTSSLPGVLEVPSTITIPAGSSGVYVPVYGRSLLADGAYISANATGYSGSATYARVRPGSVEFYTPSSFTAGQPTVITFRTRDPNEQTYSGYSAVTSPQWFRLTGDSAVVRFYAMDGVTRIDSIAVAAGSYETQFKVVPRAGGLITFGSAGNANFTNGTYNSSSSWANGASVSITDFAFTPSSVDIALNSNVTWTNNSTTVHNVTWTSTSPTPPLSSSNLNGGQTVTRSFVAPGTYTYQCSIHQTMTGSVIAH